MNTATLLEGSLLQEQRLARGIVDAVVGDEPVVVVRLDGEGDDPRLCDVLVTGAEPLLLTPGEVVLVWHPARADQRGVVIGRIGSGQHAAVSVHKSDGAEAADEIVIEAKKSLTLRVGSGSITIREDGRILIKGKDLVSHAQRTNRIKGGAVAIN